MKKLLKSIGLLVAISILTSCTETSDNKFQAPSTFSAINMSNNGEDIVYLDDFFDDCSLIDSINLPQYLEYNWDRQNHRIEFKSALQKPIENLRVYIGNSHVDFVLRSIFKDRYIFEFDPQGVEYQNLKIKGTFNNWDLEKNKFYTENGIYKCELHLLPGVYQYVLFDKGVEFTNPNDPEKVSNGIGGFNSVLKYGQMDQETPFVYSNYQNSNLYLNANRNVNYLAYIDNNLFQSGQMLANTQQKIDIPQGVKNASVRVYTYFGSKLANDILVQIKDSKIVDNTQMLSRKDLHSQIMYEVMVDRFYNGNPDNDKPLNNPEVKKIADYHGGDIKGISQKIKDGFFAELGINSIWMTPIIQNPLDAWGLWDQGGVYSKFSGYHGYWPYQTTKVDFRFGTDQELKEMIELAHQNDINVIFDFVANHVHQDSKIIKDHPDWKTDLILEDGTENIALWDSQRLTTWFDNFLPTMDLERQEVTEAVSDTAMFWLNKFEFDGLRHDACKHIPINFWKTLTKKVKSQMANQNGRQIFQIGETYSGPELISSYVNSAMLDAQFDFNLYDQIVKSFAVESESFGILKNRLEESLLYYGSHHLMGNVTGNHDKARLISYMDYSVSFDEDSKLAGWTRDIQSKDSLGFDKALMAMAFTSVIPGIPVVYYGDEIALAGGNDPDNRRMMIFDNLDSARQKLRDSVKKLLNFRKSNIASIYGDSRVLYCDDESIVILRVYLGKSTISIFNKNSAKTISFGVDKNLSGNLKSLFGKSFVEKDGVIQINLGSNQFEILYN